MNINFKWLRFFLQRFWGWFWGKWFLFAKILRKVPLDNLDSSILGARSNHPVVVRRKCKISHLTVSFWSQKKTKYILPPQILVHREVFNWSPVRFLNAPPRFHFGSENGEAQLGNHPVYAIFSSSSHPNFQLESNWISVKVKLHTISAWPLIRGTWDLSWRPGTKQL